MDHPDTECDRVMRRLDISHLPIDNDLTAVGSVKPIGDAHRRRLPRAILADDGVNSSGLYNNVDVVICEYIAEAFCDLSKFEHSGLIADTKSTKAKLTTDRVSDFNLTSDDLLFRFFGLLNRFRRNELLIEFVHRVTNAVLIKTKDVQTRTEAVVYDILDNIVDSIVDAFDHAREHKTWLHHVLIRIDTDHEMRGPPVLYALLLDGIERTQTGITRGGEDYVSAFADLRKRQFFAFTGIVPRRISHTNVIPNYLDVRIDRLGTFFITLRETMDESDVHSAKEPDRARSRCFRSEDTD